MFGKLDGRSARSMRMTIVFILLISICGNFIFFMEKYKELGIVNFYYYRDFLAVMAVFFVLAIASGFEVDNSLSSEDKSKYRKNIVYYILGAIIFILIGGVEYKLLNSAYMIFGNVVNIGLIVTLYFVSKNIWIISMEQGKKVNKYFANSKSCDYEVEPSWRWKVWFKPIIKSNIKDEDINSNLKVVVVYFAGVALLSFATTIWIVIAVVVICFTIEEVFNLNTVLIGTCTSVEKIGGTGGKSYRITVTDFKNKRECRVLYEEMPPYREGDNLKVVITLITRRRKSVRYIR